MARRVLLPGGGLRDFLKSLWEPLLVLRENKTKTAARTPWLTLVTLELMAYSVSYP